MPAYTIPDKHYFNIGETSLITQVPAYTLRYWESELNLPRPVRRPSGHRRYTRKDLETIFSIKELLYDRKLTLAGAKRTLIQKRKRKESAPVDPRILEKLRRELREILLELSR